MQVAKHGEDRRMSRRSRIGRWIDDRILVTVLKEIRQMSTDLNSALSDVETKLAGMGTSIGGVVTQLATLKTDVDTLITEVQGGLNPTEAIARLQAISVTLDQQKAALDAAAQAATPPTTIP